MLLEDEIQLESKEPNARRKAERNKSIYPINVHVVLTMCWTLMI